MWRESTTGSIEAPKFITNCDDSPTTDFSPKGLLHGMRPPRHRPPNASTHSHPRQEQGSSATLRPQEQDGLEMVAVHVGKLHAAKELLLGEVLGDVGQVQSSLPVVALIQVIFVLEDFLGREGQGNPTSPACRAQFSPRHYTAHHSTRPHRQPSLRHMATAPRSSKSVSTTLLLAHQALGSQETEQSHTAKHSIASSQTLLEQVWAAKGGSSSRVTACKYHPPRNTDLGAGAEVQWGTKRDSIYLPSNVEEVQPRQREGRSS